MLPHVCCIFSFKKPWHKQLKALPIPLNSVLSFCSSFGCCCCCCCWVFDLVFAPPFFFPVLFYALASIKQECMKQYSIVLGGRIQHITAGGLSFVDVDVCLCLMFLLSIYLSISGAPVSQAVTEWMRECFGCSVLSSLSSLLKIQNLLSHTRALLVFCHFCR